MTGAWTRRAVRAGATADRRPLLLAAALLLLGAGLQFLRNAAPFFSPTLYAEDGVWTAYLYRDGFVDTALNARDDFPVLGLVLLLRIGLSLTTLFAGDDLSQLGAVNAVLAYLTVAAVATAPVLMLRGVLNVGGRLVIWAWTVLLPLGAVGSNELIGRILNLTFLAPTLAGYVVAWFLIKVPGPLAAVVGGVLAFVCAMTLPTALGVVGVGAVLALVVHGWPLLRRGGVRALRTRPGLQTLLPGGVLLLVSALTVTFLPATALSSKGGTAGLTVEPSGFIAYIGGRMILYPFVKPFYEALTDVVVVVGVLALVALVLLALLRGRSGARRRALLGLSVAAGLNIVALGAARAGFTTLFTDYSSTYPDRYFYGVNVLVVATVVLAAAEVGSWLADRSTGASAALVRAAIPTALAGLLVLSLGGVFEGRAPRQSFDAIGTFEQAVTAELCPGTELVPDGDDTAGLQVAIYPYGPGVPWRMTLPLEVARATGGPVTCTGGP